MLRRKNVLELVLDGLDVTIVGDLRDLAVLDVTNTDQGVKTLLGLLTGFWVGHVLVVGVKLRHQLRQERGNDVGVLDKLAHVVDNDSGLSLDWRLTLLETTLKQRNHDGKGGLVDVSDESGSTEQVNGLRDVLWLGDTLDELRNEALNVLVGDKLADLLHGAVGLLLHLSLGVPHSLGDNWDKVRHTDGSLRRRSLSQGLDTLEVGHLLGPLLGVADRVDVVWDEGLDGVGVDGLGDGKCGVLRGDLDRDHLVADGSKDVREQLNQVWLNDGGNVCVLGDGGDGLASVLVGVGILLVVQHRAELLDGHSRGGMLLDVAVDEGSDLLGEALRLVTWLADGQLAHQLLQHLRALLVLLLDLTL